MSPGLGDGPVDPRYVEQMNSLAQMLDESFNGEAKGKDRTIGFCLLLFEFGNDPGRINYISNADRADVVTMLKEQLARFEGQAEPKEGSA
jgi:hypothetical protein